MSILKGLRKAGVKIVHLESFWYSCKCGNKEMIVFDKGVEPTEEVKCHKCKKHMMKKGERT